LDTARDAFVIMVAIRTLGIAPAKRLINNFNMLETSQVRGKAAVLKELNVREARLVRGLLEGLTPTEAMVAAGYSRSTAEARPLSVVGKSRVREALRSAMDRQGLTAERLAKTIKAGLDATRKVVVGSQVFEEPDHATRHRFLQTAVRLRGEDLKHQKDASPGETYEDRIKRLRDRGRKEMPSKSEPLESEQL
jgi:hypothetical protein